MPLWIVIMVLGATGCGWLFLKTRGMENKATLRKVKEGHKSVKKAARHTAKRPSGVEVTQPVTSEEEINLSADMPSIIAKEIEAIFERKE